MRRRDMRRRDRDAQREVFEAYQSYEKAKARESRVEHLVDMVHQHTEANGFAVVIRRALGAQRR